MVKSGLCVTIFAIAATAPVRAVTNVNLYQRVEETMVNTTSLANRFTDTELRLSVTAPANRPLGSGFTCLKALAARVSPGCGDADLNADNTIDPQDVNVFTSCVRGADQPPGCAEEPARRT